MYKRLMTSALLARYYLVAVASPDRLALGPPTRQPRPARHRPLGIPSSVTTGSAGILRRSGCG